MKKRAKPGDPDKIGVARATLELCKAALGAIIRAVLENWFNNH
jgi:hypothetical protein